MGMEGYVEKNLSAIDEVLAAAEEIRQKLNKNSCLLELYLVMFLNAVAIINLNSLEAYTGAVLDTAFLDEIRGRINWIIGPGPMENLNELLRRVFLSAKPTGAPLDDFVRDMNAALINNLICRRG